MPDEFRAAELIITGNLQGQFVQNILHFGTEIDDAADPYQWIEEAIDNLNDVIGFFASWCDVLPVDYTLLSLRYRQIYPIGAATLLRLGNTLTAFAGTRTGEVSAQQNAPLIKLVTTLTPNEPGRIFMPGVSEADATGGLITADLAEAFDPLLLALREYWSGTTPTTQCRWYVKHGDPPASFSQVFIAQIMPSLYSQRRRMKPRV